MSLRFNEKSHRYWMDKKPTTGVTTLLKSGLPIPGLMYWSARTVAEYVAENYESVGDMLRTGGPGPTIGFLKGTPWAKRDEAAVKGTAVHALAERVIHGTEVDVPEHLHDYVQGYVDFLDAFKVEPILTEKSCGNRRWWYTGRFDTVARIDGAVTLLDLKAGKGVYGSTALQCAAYARAEFYVEDDDIDTEYPMPVIERIAVAHVTDGGTTLHDLGDIDEAFKIFTHVQYLAKQKDRIDAFLSEPVEPPTQKDVA